MQIKEIGEFGLIRRFSRLIQTDASVIKGSGDDCAVLKLDKENYLLFTCDMLSEGVDFFPDDDPYLIGRKSLAVSLSDIAACAGTPRHCLISLGLSQNTPIGFADKLMRGMLDIAREYKVNIVGGDLSGLGKLTIDVSMLGTVRKRDLVLRSGAQKGDIIFVTGRLGGSIRGKHLRFHPRLEEAHFLVKNFKVKAMIDISDGLAQDLGHILEESRVGAVIYEELLPFSREARSVSEVLYMGEDFELLFTLKPPDARKLMLKRMPEFRPIGAIMQKSYGLKIVDRSGREKNLRPKGYRHF